MQIQQEVLWNSSLGTRLKNPTPSLPSLSIPSLPSLSMPKVYRNRYDGRILRIVIYLVVWLCGFQFFFVFWVILSWVLEERLETIVIPDMLIDYYCLLLLLVPWSGCSWGPSMALTNCILLSTGNETVGFWIQFKWVCFFVFRFIYLFIFEYWFETRAI